MTLASFRACLVGTLVGLAAGLAAFYFWWSAHSAVPLASFSDFLAGRI